MIGLKTYTLYNVTGNLINKPCSIMQMQARGFDDAFVKFKKELSDGLRNQLGLDGGNKIKFTEPKIDSSIGYGSNVRYTTCSIEDENGFVSDIYEYAISLNT